MTKLSKTMSLLIVLIVYIAAFLIGLLVFRLSVNLHAAHLAAFLIADVAATIFVWLTGLCFKNASIYDPYWSIAPIILTIGFISKLYSINAITTMGILYLIILTLWGLRLTLNWAIGWQGFRQQDWRYTMLKKKNPKLWLITNFFGINMMPTLIVFINMIPVYYGIRLHNGALNVLSILGALICLMAILLQSISDWQMRKFRKINENKSRNMENGLWRYSRHPNYLGEVSLWWGVWLMQVSVMPHLWWTVFAPILMTLLFVFISIPMIEKRLMQSKQGYSDYVENTSMLLLLPKKS